MKQSNSLLSILYKIIRRLKKYFRLIIQLMVFFFNHTINKPLGVIYMLHRVDTLDETKLNTNEELKISPEFLEKFILMKKDKYEFISLDDLINIYNKKRKQHKPFIIFTLDDGYKDNYKIAYPVFKKYNVPFTVFVATDYIENKDAFLWWYVLEEIINRNKIITLTSGETYICDTKENKISVFWQLRNKVFTLPYSSFKNSFYELFSGYLDGIDSNYSDKMLDWNEIKMMSEDALCTIGAHSKAHFKLSNLTDKELFEEICGSRNIIEKKIGKLVKHFSYPYGSPEDVDNRCEQILSKINFDSALISWGGEIRKFNSNLYALPRIMLTEIPKK